MTRCFLVSESGPSVSRDPEALHQPWSYCLQALTAPIVQFAQSSEMRTHAPQTSEVYALLEKTVTVSITYIC